MKIKPLAFLSSCTILAIASSVILSLSEKVSTAQTTIPEVYKEALIDAAEPKREEVLDKLTVINESNSNLIWDGQRGKSRVLVATFAKANRYSSDRPITLSSSLEIWVTVVPELKNFCKNYNKTEVNNAQLNLRLKQLLGLPSHKEYVEVAEIWVDPKYLKRPTSNPEIKQYTAQSLIKNQGISLTYEGNDEKYKPWLSKQIEEQQKNRNSFNNSTRLNNTDPNDDPYPWTGLGYTYDWEPKTNLQSHAGLSEFVILANPQVSTPIEVKQVLPTEQYCQTK